MRVPRTASSNQSILKEMNPEYSLEGLMLKMKLQYFGHLMQRTDSLEKTKMLGRIEGRRRRGSSGLEGWIASLSQHEFEQTDRDSGRQRSLECCSSWGHNELVLHIRWPKYWSFSFNISPSNEYSGLISLRIDWLDLGGTLLVTKVRI